jgi:SulP family sulfate permease
MERRVSTTPGPSESLSRWIPAARWLRHYERAWLPADIAAGATLGAVMVPVGLAFGELAGMPMAGLYAGIVPLVLYALFGSSRQLIIGPDATMATVVVTALAPIAAGDPVQLAALVALLAIGMGSVLILAGVLRLGFLADFLAKPVIVGFMHGLALVIVAGQLPKVLGISSGGDTTLDQLVHAARNAGQTHLPTLVIGVLSVAVILTFRRWVPRVPGQIVVLIGALAASAALHLSKSGVAVVGEIPRGLPALRVPYLSWEIVREILPVALGAALLAFSDTIVTARGFASRNRYSIDANRELVALGLGNLGSAVTQGLPVSGSSSRTAVGESAGGRTPVVSLAAAATVALVLMFLAPHLTQLPSAVLGGILMAAAWGLCDFGEFAALWRFRSIGFVIAIVVLAGVIGLGVMEGILLGVVCSVVLVLRAIAFPHGATLGRTDDGYHDFLYRPDARPVEDAILYRFSGPLFFANCGQLRNRIESLSQEKDVKLFVLDASVIFEVDFAACETLIDVHDSLHRRGIQLAVANLRDHVKTTLARGGVVAHLGESAFFPTIDDAIRCRLIGGSSHVGEGDPHPVPVRGQ